MPDASSLCLMAVHAHPDDECFSGGIFGRYAGEGVRTVLVTCTLGEEGEIVDPTMDEQAIRPRLGDVRTEELRCSAAALGVEKLHQLGYRDSGMAGTPANANPKAFTNVDVAAATARLVELVRAERPQVMVTYDEQGGYGHPDHIMAHRLAVGAFEGAGDAERFPVAPGGAAPFAPSKLYHIGMPLEGMLQLRHEIIARGLPDPFANMGGDSAASNRPSTPPSFLKPASVITTYIDVAPYVDRKLASFHCHRTQIAPTAFPFTLPEDIMRRALSQESFVLARSRVPASRPENDLFAGLH